jgi:hypothetical protein
MPRGRSAEEMERSRVTASPSSASGGPIKRPSWPANAKLRRVIAYDLADLLRRLVLPLAIQSWSLTSLQHASSGMRGTYPPASREPLDAAPVWADPPARRATHVTSDLIERTAHGGSETRSGAIAGVSPRAVLKRSISGEERAAIANRTPLIDFAWAARQVGERAARLAAQEEGEMAAYRKSR